MAAPSLFPLDAVPAPAAARPRPARRAVAAAPPPEIMVPTGPSEAMRSVLEEARRELVAARELIEELVRSRRHG
jgi:hypothetical protein